MPSNFTHSTWSRWALTAAAAFAFTIAAHELAHIAAGLVACPFTPEWRSVSAFAGPVTSVLIVAMAVVWTARGERSPDATRWAIALGLTAATRVFLVWLVAGPWLLGAAPRATFDERQAAVWPGILVDTLLIVETILAAAGGGWLMRMIPRNERRAALLAMAAVIVVIGTIALVVNPRV